MTMFLGFLAVSIMVIVTPGPDTATTIRGTLLGGRRGGLYTAAGIAAGQVLWALATSLGLAALLIASELLFMAIRYAGACFLIYLGAQALREAVRQEGGVAAERVINAPTGRLSHWTAMRQGLVSNLGNPKMAVFFTSLLPQFVPPASANFLSLLALGCVFSLLTFIWLTLYAIAIDKAGELLCRPKVRRWLEAITGTVLIALGVRVALDLR